MQIYFKALGPVLTNGYLVVDDYTKNGVIIDTPADGFEFYDKIIQDKNIELTEIWLTHTHWDHTWDLNKIKSKYNVPVLVHKDDLHRLDNPNDYINFDLGIKFEKMNADKFIHNNDKLTIGELEFKVLHTPGHTEGGVCFINFDEKIIIAGDTLFQNSIGRTDLAGGNYELLINSIKTQLLTLPEDFEVYCGHGNKTNIRHEKLFNPFLV